MRPIIFTIVLFTLAACSAAATAAPDPVALGGRTFTVQCGGCHAISDVGVDSFGPRLGAMFTRAQASADPQAWLRTAITDPNGEVAPGYQPGLMPITYGQGLTPAEIDALVAYMLSTGEQQK